MPADCDLKPVPPITTFADNEPVTPELHYTKNGIFLRMDEQGLQALAIIARGFIDIPTERRRATIPGYNAYECAADELAGLIADAT